MRVPSEGNQPPIPLLVLLLVAAASGVAAALVARRYPGVRPRPATMPVSAPRAVTGRRAWLLARLDPDLATGLSLTLALTVIVAGGLVLAGLAVVVRDTHVLAGIDNSVADWGDRHATAFSTGGLKLVTDLGETWTAVVAGIVVVVVEALTARSRWVVPFLLAVIVGDKLLTEAIKQLVDRLRPHLNPIAATLGPSFPSGHSSTAAALWAAVALVAGRWWGRRAWPLLVGLAVGIAVGVAASRVLLDVHWLTDVLAGLALGWAWFAACTVVFARRVLRFGGTGSGSRTSRPPVSGATRSRAPGGGGAVKA